MSEEGNYRGKVLTLIRESGASIGDIVKVEKDTEVYQGALIPKTHTSRGDYIVLKLKSGYNIGVRISDTTRIHLVEGGSKPVFKRPPLPIAKKGLPSVHLYSTGGTIASRVDYRTGGVEPALNAEDLYSIIPELSEVANIHATILFSEFSENLFSSHWKRMAESVSDAVKQGTEGVVICHGTDTLGYTAAALSFSLINLPVPVILVGSQRSSDRPSSDAASNLVGAVDISAKAPFAEVVVVMHENISDNYLIIHKGTKVRKCHTSSRDAFQSINADSLARYNIIEREFNNLESDIQKRRSRSDFTVKNKFDENVALLKFYPTLNPAILNFYVEKDVRGIILEGTGLGHVGRQCYEPIKDAIKKDIFVGMTSQCLWGRVNLNVYYTGRDLLSYGVTPLGDMLPETALIKLMWVLGQTEKPEEIKNLMTTNLAGEMSKRRWIK